MADRPVEYSTRQTAAAYVVDEADLDQTNCRMTLGGAIGILVTTSVVVAAVFILFAPLLICAWALPILFVATIIIGILIAKCPCGLVAEIANATLDSYDHQQHTHQHYPAVGEPAFGVRRMHVRGTGSRGAPFGRGRGGMRRMYYRGTGSRGAPLHVRRISRRPGGVTQPVGRRQRWR